MGILPERWRKKFEEQYGEIGKYKYWVTTVLDVIFIIFLVVYFNYMKQEMNDCGDVFEQFIEGYDRNEIMERFMNYSNISLHDFDNMSIEDKIYYSKAYSQDKYVNVTYPIGFMGSFR